MKKFFNQNMAKPTKPLNRALTYIYKCYFSGLVAKCIR